MRVATATSNLMIGVTASAGGLIYLFRGGIDHTWRPDGRGVFVGASLASRLSDRVELRVLRLLFTPSWCHGRPDGAAGHRMNDARLERDHRARAGSRSDRQFLPARIGIAGMGVAHVGRRIDPSRPRSPSPGDQISPP